MYLKGQVFLFKISICLIFSLPLEIKKETAFFLKDALFVMFSNTYSIPRLDFCSKTQKRSVSNPLNEQEERETNEKYA